MGVREREGKWKGKERKGKGVDSEREGKWGLRWKGRVNGRGWGKWKGVGRMEMGVRGGER